MRWRKRVKMCFLVRERSMRVILVVWRKDKRGRGAKDKTPVFGLLKRGGKVHTKIIPDTKRDTLIPIIKEKVIPDI